MPPTPQREKALLGFQCLKGSLTTQHLLDNGNETQFLLGEVSPKQFIMKWGKQAWAELFQAQGELKFVCFD